jgi:hypothetical protein
MYLFLISRRSDYVYTGIPAISANHTAGFTEAAGTQPAHKATLQTAKALSATGLRVLLDRDFLRSVGLFPREAMIYINMFYYLGEGKLQTKTLDKIM